MVSNRKLTGSEKFNHFPQALHKRCQLYSDTAFHQSVLLEAALTALGCTLMLSQSFLVVLFVSFIRVEILGGSEVVRYHQCAFNRFSS